MFNLNCSVQQYAWGRIGTESSSAVFKAAQDKDFIVDDNVKYAELWMGTHPRGPSTLLQANSEPIQLSDYLKEKGDAAIGEAISKHFYGKSDGLMTYGDLPFLFKVLSINKALSIQAHPNKTLAKQLHENDPKNYPDANHKPEMIVSITEKFEAMCGFRVSTEISKHFKLYEELRVLCGEKNCENFVAGSGEKLKDILAECLRSLMSKEAAVISKQFHSLHSTLQAKSETETTDLEKLFIRLASQYPEDVGCFVVFLLNCFSLRKGEAIYLAANVPHAYLFGEGVECMACSDNVVRAGLTPKFKDVDILCSMLDYSMRSSDDNKLSSTRTALSQDKDYLTEFIPTVDEFSIQQIHIEKKHLTENSGEFLIPKSKSGSVLIVVEASCDQNSFVVSDLNDLPAKAGLVYFIDANTDVNFKVSQPTNSNTVLLAYRAYCEIKN